MFNKVKTFLCYSIVIGLLFVGFNQTAQYIMKFANEHIWPNFQYRVFASSLLGFSFGALVSEAGWLVLSRSFRKSAYDSMPKKLKSTMIDF